VSTVITFLSGRCVPGCEIEARPLIPTDVQPVIDQVRPLADTDSVKRHPVAPRLRAISQLLSQRRCHDAGAAKLILEAFATESEPMIASVQRNMGGRAGRNGTGVADL
jgi:hypothetical protein